MSKRRNHEIATLGGWRLYFYGAMFSLEQLRARYGIRIQSARDALQQIQAALREEQHALRVSNGRKGKGRANKLQHGNSHKSTRTGRMGGNGQKGFHVHSIITRKGGP